MPYFAVLLGCDADLAVSFVVRADRHGTAGAALCFLRDDRVVHQVPSTWVDAVVCCASELEARDAVAAQRRAHVGGATIHVHETSAGAPRRRGKSGAPTAVPAEGLTIRIDEGRR